MFVKKTSNNMPANFQDAFGQKYVEVVIRTDENEEYLFLQVFPDKFLDNEEKRLFFNAAKSLKVGTPPVCITEKNSGANADIILMYIRKLK